MFHRHFVILMSIIVYGAYCNVLDSSEITFSCPKSWGVYPDECDCSSYYICYNGIPQKLKCRRSKKGVQFNYNPELQVCDPRECEYTCHKKAMIENSEELSVPSAPSLCTISRRWPREFAIEYPWDCHYYYHCDDSLRRVYFLKCPTDTTFDADNGYCDHKNKNC